MRGNELISAVSLNNFMIISTRRDQDKVQDFLHTIKKVGPPMGIGVSNRCNVTVLDNDRTDNFLSAIDKNVTPDTQMVSC